MNTTRLLAFLLFAGVAQGAAATTIWLKDRDGNVCRNSANNNAGGVVGLASVDRNGVIRMVIDNPNVGTETRNPSTGDCANLPRTVAGVPLVFTGSLIPQIVPVHMQKPGTKGAIECLDQGSSYSGVRGTVSAPSTPYSMEMGFFYVDGCTSGRPLPTFVRSVAISDNSNPDPDAQPVIFTGLYHIFNENAVPEPGSLALLLAGAASLILVGMRQRRLARQV